MTIQRVRVFNQGVVGVSAAKAWAYLTDWAGSKRQRRASGMGDLAVAQIILEGREDEIPRTRIMEFGAFGAVRETLLHLDDTAMHLYYNIEGVGPYGIKNYLATTDIDALCPDRCQVTITARFDLAAADDLVKAKGLIDFAHNQAVIGAMRAHFAVKA
jgi:hypothetical protein